MVGPDGCSDVTAMGPRSSAAQCLQRGHGDPGSALLNQQLMLANRFSRISQCFSESGEVGFSQSKQLSQAAL